MLSSGARIGHYEILDAIGAGGMGEVYRARDTKLGREVAIKVLPEAFARDSARMARFSREAKLLAALDHPNIASIYGIEDSGDTRALVMQLAAGETLADRVRQALIPIDETLRIARQIADALEYAHEKGIIHRDLKPANVKVAADDTVKILDFGLAKAMESELSPEEIANSPTISHLATQAGVLLGTAAYMSPEQAKAKPVDRRADIWAFGCVLYEMLTGKMAFHGDSVTDTLAAVIKEEPDWSLLPATTPMRVRVLLQRCLQKDVRQRLQSMGDARISLEEVLSGAPESLFPPSTAPSAARWLWPSAAAACLLIAIAGWLTFFYWHPRSPAAAVQRFEIAPPPGGPSLSPFQSSVVSISPDGTVLLFFGTGAGGVSQLWMRRMDSPDAHPIAGTEGAAGFPFWSPDSRSVAFAANRKLKKMDLASGSVQELCDVGDSPTLGGFWTLDGRIVFSAVSSARPDLFEVSASGGTASPFSGVERPADASFVGIVSPVLLPDARHFIYLAGTSSNLAVYLGSLDSGPRQPPRLLTRASFFSAGPPAIAFVPSPHDSTLGYLLFTRVDSNGSGTLLAQLLDLRRLELTGDPVPVAEGVSFGGFSASVTGILAYRASGSTRGTRLTWFDRQGKVLGTGGEDAPYYGTPALSPDGTRAALTRRDSPNGNLVIWLVGFSRGTTTRFTFGSSSADYPIWSPDGKRIIFRSNSYGEYDLYQKPANGAEGEQLLLKSSENKYPSSLSRDGRFLLYFSINPKKGSDLWVLPLTGEQKPFPFLRTGFYEVDGHFSPDGHWVAYTSDESGRYEVYVRRFSGDAAAPALGEGAQWQVSYESGSEPRWSPDGKELYYLTLDGKLMAVGVSAKTVFEAGTPKLLFQTPQPNTRTAGDYTVDGKRFFFLSSTEQTAQAPFTVVLNWQAALKK